MLDFHKFWQELLALITQLAKKTIKEDWQAALQDGKDIVEKNEAKLQKWLILLNNGDIDQEDFKFLCAGLKDLAEMEALKQAGLKAARIDQFRDQVIGLVIGTAFKFIV